jgi:alkylation response protein AidB-like acyl-CoA dehydrogenase
MDFSLTEDELAFRAKIRAFAENDIKPIVPKLEKTEEFPWENVKKMADMGLFGLIFSKEYCGLELGYIYYAIAVEEISRVCGSHGITVASHNSLCSNHINIAGTEEQKKKYLTPLAKGEKLGAWGLTEPNAGSDAGGTQTTAVLDGDEWVINGAKQFITQGSVGEIYVVIASTDKSKKQKGITAFIIEKGTPGFRPGLLEHKLGLKISDTSELIMEDCRVPKENMLGELDRAFYDTMKVLDGGRISIGAMGLGLAQGALDEALKYVKQRQQFGKPISKFQAIQWQLADMATEIEAARLLIYRAAYMANKKTEKYTKESAMGKLYASEVGMRAARKAVQIMGGIGYTKRAMVERIMRDVKLCEIGEGTSEIQRLVIARHLGIK